MYYAFFQRFYEQSTFVYFPLSFCNVFTVTFTFIVVYCFAIIYQNLLLFYILMYYTDGYLKKRKKKRMRRGIYVRTFFFSFIAKNRIIFSTVEFRLHEFHLVESNFNRISS